MSIESAKSFIERLKVDEEFAQKVIACKDSQERMAFVQTTGFDFTVENLESAKGQLSDEELESAVGGNLIGDVVGQLVCGVAHITGQHSHMQ